MLSFYPGPSKVYPQVEGFIKEAFHSGLLGQNHRSPVFVDMYKECVRAMKEKLEIPADYTIMFTSSATECWEIIAQSLVGKKSLHLYNGAFGQKWFEYTQRIHAASECRQFEIEELLEAKAVEVSDDVDIICLTHNETSTATVISEILISDLKAAYPDKLIAVDATSSLAGQKLDMASADVWYASVQKCFGLPAGMAVLICSPQAVKVAKTLNEKQHYNSLVSILDMAEKNQTTYTPNVLYIYVLMRLMQTLPGIAETDRATRSKAEELYQFFEKQQGFELLVKNPSVRSLTVLALQGDEHTIQGLKVAALEEGILLGNGYGHWAKTTFRIANFPAHSLEEMNKLQGFMQEFIK